MHKISECFKIFIKKKRKWWQRRAVMPNPRPFAAGPTDSFCGFCSSQPESCKLTGGPSTEILVRRFSAVPLRTTVLD